MFAILEDGREFLKRDMRYKRKPWLRPTLQVRGSVIPFVLERSLWCGFVGLLISILYLVLKIPVAQPILGGIIPSIVLALLLVFRTNTAYERFWEGRRAWGFLVVTIRNITWRLWASIAEVEPGDRERKIAALRLLIALGVAKKHHLRSEPASSELAALVSHEQYLTLKNVQHMPFHIVYWLGDYLQQEFERNRLNNYQLIAIQNLLNSLVHCVGICDRILKTPMPLAYSIHLKQLVLIYCLMLPFQLVKDLGWWTGFFVALISFALFGIEEIGIEIENPFGYDANDIPLDSICSNIKQTVEEFINTHTN